jgi:hypothetical protein
LGAEVIAADDHRGLAGKCCGIVQRSHTLCRMNAPLTLSMAMPGGPEEDGA